MLRNNGDPAMPDQASLPKPTLELVLAEGERFDHDYEVTEGALAELIKQFPRNTDRSQVLLKVAAINQLYTVNVYAVRIVADHIADLKIDAHLDAGSVQLVDMIAQVRLGENKQRTYLSFASKYCSWHRPADYPIWDACARKCLSAYKLEFGLGFARADLWEYISFFDAVKEFRDRFGLRPLTFKQIDKFLYLKGAALIEAERHARAAAKQDLRPA
jgi:hypothetical protein